MGELHILGHGLVHCRKANNEAKKRANLVATAVK
jgi:hypothetical protein